LAEQRPSVLLEPHTGTQIAHVLFEFQIPAHGAELVDLRVENLTLDANAGSSEKHRAYINNKNSTFKKRLPQFICCNSWQLFSFARRKFLICRFT